MRTAEYGSHFACSLFGNAFCYGGGNDLTEVILCQNTFHHRCVRSQYIIVLIHTHSVVAFLFHHTDDTERYCAETNNLSDRVRAVREDISVWLPSVIPMFTRCALRTLPSSVHTLFLAFVMS